jgi:hypothetical protein
LGDSQREGDVTRSLRKAQDREILRLDVPAFLALVAEPHFLLADSAVVGHLGTPQLAALGIASAVLGTLVSLSIFLAYGTTASVARQVGAGNTRGALTQGVDGLWLGHPDRRRRRRGRVATDRARRRPVRSGCPGGGARRDLPADRPARHSAAPADAGGHRRAARPAGHAHPAGRGSHREPRQHRAQRHAGLRGRVCSTGWASPARRWAR